MTTLFKVTKQQHYMEAVNAAGTIQAAFAYTHPLAGMFAPGRETLFAECSVQGKFIDVKKLVTEKDWNRAKARKASA